MRIVSLVPSLTEAVAVTRPGVLVGCTDWCTHPAGLAESGVARVRGTKNPDLDAIVALAPDLVLANEEENRPADLDELGRRGIEVLVTTICSVPQAVAELDRVVAACGAARPEWLDRAEAGWLSKEPAPEPRRLAVVPIWRRPWMALGRDTYAGDVLARLGVANVLAHSSDRYPRFDPAEVISQRAGRRLDLVVLPDEPYAFTATDGPQAFPGIPAALVSGRLLTWYGPAMVDAVTELAADLDRTV